MQNVWRGLAIGALVGAAVGIVLDLANKTKRAVTNGYEGTRQAVMAHGPDAAVAVKEFAGAIADAARDGAHAAADQAHAAADRLHTSADKAHDPHGT